MNIAVMGRRHQGKSTLARYIAERIQRRVKSHTILIYDPKRTFKAIPHTSDLGQLELMITDPHYTAVAYQPLGLSSELGEDARAMGDVVREFDLFFNALGIEYHLGMGDESPRKNLGPVVLIVDEAWMLQQRGTINGCLARLVRLADSENFYLIQAAHRPSDFGTGTRAQLDVVFFFRQFLPEDLDIVRDWAGEEVAAKVGSLPQHHVIRYEVGAETWELWDRPENWYLDNGGNDVHDAASGPSSSSSEGPGTQVVAGA